jgi:hypothetical protein
MALLEVIIKHSALSILVGDSKKGAEPSFCPFFLYAAPSEELFNVA